MKYLSPEWIFSLIILLIVYQLSIMISGIIQARLAARFGDSTAEDLGYGNFDFITYFNPISIIFLILFNFPTLGNTIPINDTNIVGPKRLMHLFILHLSEFLVYLGLSFVALLTSIISFGQLITVNLTHLMFLSSATPLREASTYMQNASASSIIFALVLTSFVFVNTIIATFSLIYNGFKYALVLGFDKGYKYAEHAEKFFLGGLLVIIFFGPVIRIVLLKFIIWVASFVTLFLGVL